MALPGMAADAEDKHLMADMIPINLTMVQESGFVVCRTFVADREITSEVLS
jgi:hypothetical protein